jgi:hypothetical protein
MMFMIEEAKADEGDWIGEIIADEPQMVYSSAIGDADNDGENEVVVGLLSSSDEVRMYEKGRDNHL